MPAVITNATQQEAVRSLTGEVRQAFRLMWPVREGSLRVTARHTGAAAEESHLLRHAVPFHPLLPRATVLPARGAVLADGPR